MRLRVFSASLAAMAAVLLTGCSATEEEQVDVSEYFVSADQQKDLAACLSDRGWDVVFDDETATISTTLAEEQNDLYEADTEACAQEVGIDFSKPLTEEDYEVVYEWYSSIGDCLAREGWAVPERPSFETFASTYDSDPWIPWIEIPGDQMGEAGQKCPQLNQGKP